MRDDLGLGREPLERGGNERQPRNHAGLPRDDDGTRGRALRDGRDRGHIAGAAEVFGKRARHGIVNFERGEESVGAEEGGHASR